MAPSPSKLAYALYEVTTQTSKKVLNFVLEAGTPRRQAGKTFCEYLIEVKSISRTTFRKKFNQSQRKKMEKSGDIMTFDVSLICLCIEFGCDGLAPPGDTRWTTSADTLERYVTSIKNKRNDFLHDELVVDDQNFFRVIEELRDLLNKALKKAAEIYNIDDYIIQGKLEDLNKEINSLRDNPSQTSGCHGMVLDRLRQQVKVEGKQELKKIYRKESSFGPASNLLGKSKVRVDKVFTTMEIMQGGSHESIQYSELLTKAVERREQKGKDCSVLLIEGPAGVGKTTLTRKMISDWASGASSMKTLTDYEFVYLSRCRDEINSLGHLLGSLMPKFKIKVQGEHGLIECIQQNRLMFIVDGLDELHSSTDRVLREIMEMGRTDDITVLCTTRPNKVPDFNRYAPENYDIMHVKVLGIEENRREEFVRNYSQALQDQHPMNRDISGLLQYLARKDSRMQAHWRFPFNLVLVTILWFFDPHAVNSLTTATELFTKTHELCIKRLLQRLSDHEETRTVEGAELKDKVMKLMKKLCKEAFINHCGDAVVLSKPSVQRLKEACRLPKLPANEVLGAFLSQATSLTGDDVRYSFPHKGFQDFYAAMHVMEIIMADELGLNIPEIIDGIENVLRYQEVPQNISSSLLRECNLLLSKCQREAARQLPSIQSVLEEETKDAAKYNNKEIKLNLIKYQNIFIHLTGLLHLRGKPLAEERSKELVELLKATGIRDTSQWLDLLSEVKCDGSMSELLARAMDLTKDIRISDGHLAAFMRVLSHARPSLLVLDIRGDPEDIPCLRDVLVGMIDATWEVELNFRHDFRHPRAGGSVLDDTLQQVFRSGRLKVTVFRGQLSGSALAALPSSLMELYLAVKDDDHYQDLLPTLSSLQGRLPRLKWIALHVPVGLDAASLRPLPSVEYPSLYVSGVEEATFEGASRVVAALQPSRGYFHLLFPGASEGEALARLVGQLGREGVRVRGAVLASPRINGGREGRLGGLVRTGLGCGFWTMDEEFFWRYDKETNWSHL
ncbi:uncharacterized protein LOC125024758 [Penaeus chinensis]|uniref:uncharacterized protein LOC125024758 n=1 Tax=Penaeus chinensis TaxID=139456 RepID=UPI001FB7585D|nr:uncharacterized protein LOC125024758 [Penaeus chinensis]